MVDNIEKKALKITVIANLILAMAGWMTFYLTNSQAMLLDGNFSFVLALATIFAVKISKNKHRKTATFPFGSYALEATFVLVKGFMILGVILVAFVQSTFKIIDFLNGQRDEIIELTPIFYYSAFVLVIFIFLIWYFNKQNKIISNRSSMLLVELKSAKVDGLLTLATGLTFFALSFIVMGSPFEFLLFIGDSIIVLVMSVLMISIPLNIIKESFIELSGGTIQNKDEKNFIINVIKQVVDGRYLFDTYISKIGSGYVVVIYVKHNNNTNNIQSIITDQQQVKKQLRVDFPIINVEISIRD